MLMITFWAETRLGSKTRKVAVKTNITDTGALVTESKEKNLSRLSPFLKII